MRDVFISSVQRDYGDVREAVRRAVESLGMRPVMAESAGAFGSSPRRALLDLVGECDLFLLLIGSRYSKPTEDEFNEASRLGKTILVLKQNVEVEPEQAAFVDRATGGWTTGLLRGEFDDAADASLAAVKALSNALAAGPREQLVPVAQSRATSLAGETRAGTGHGSVARVAFAPLVASALLDAVALDAADLGETVTRFLREHRLVAQSVGVNVSITRDGVAIAAVGSYVNASPIVIVGADGAVMVEFSVAGDDQFGGSRIDPDRLRVGIDTAGAFARDVWTRIDQRDDVQQVAVIVAIPDAQHKVFGSSTGGNSISLGWGMPQRVSVPELALVVRRADVGTPRVSAHLVAEVKRVFVDAKATGHG